MSNIILFDGIHLTMIKDGEEVYSTIAISGRVGYQSPDAIKKSMGTIPSGSYEVHQDKYQNRHDISIDDEIRSTYITPIARVFNKSVKGTWPGGTYAWGDERIWLQPTDDTETYGRGGFSLHGGSSPGSAV